MQDGPAHSMAELEIDEVPYSWSAIDSSDKATNPANSDRIELRHPATGSIFTYVVPDQPANARGCAAIRARAKLAFMQELIGKDRP